MVDDWNDWVDVASKNARWAWKHLCFYTNEWNVGQFLLLALFIVMLPYIIKAIVSVITAAIKSIIQMFLLTLLVAVAINAYLGNSASIGELWEYFQKFVKNALKGVIQD